MKGQISIRTATNGLRALMCLALLLTTCSPVFATAPTLPDTGVDLTEWVPVVITGMGAIVAVVIGGYFAFLLIRKGLRWVSRAFG